MKPVVLIAIVILLPLSFLSKLAFAVSTPAPFASVNTDQAAIKPQYKKKFQTFRTFIRSIKARYKLMKPISKAVSIALIILLAALIIFGLAGISFLLAYATGSEMFGYIFFFVSALLTIIGAILWIRSTSRGKKAPFSVST